MKKLTLKAVVSKGAAMRYNKIIILKNGKKVKKLEKIDNSKNKSRKEKNTKEKDYILFNSYPNRLFTYISR